MEGYCNSRAIVIFRYPNSGKYCNFGITVTQITVTPITTLI